MRVLMVGPDHGNELKYIPSEINLINVNAPWAVKELPDEDFDAVLITCFGSASSRVINLGITKYKCPVGVWFLDSHVLFEEEMKLARLLPYIFIAHSHYINDFKRELPGKDIYHMPCCTNHIISIDEWGPPNKIREYDVFQASIPYHVFGDSRIKILAKMKSLLPNCIVKLSENLPHDQYVPELRKTRVGLNVSLGGDFNCRNIEIIASGIPVMADRTVDHSSPMLEGIDKFISYFERSDLSKMQKVYDEALTKAEISAEYGQKWALNHSYSARTLFMLNTMMKTKFEMEK